VLVKDFDYQLPAELIAQTALAERTAARLMVIDRQRGLVAESVFAQIGQWLRAGDLLVINDARVMPARLKGQKTTGGRVELLLLEQQAAQQWSALVRPGRRLPLGSEIMVAAGRLQARILERLPRGERLVALSWDPAIAFSDLLEEIGEVPLPPYIHQPLADRERYQTVYSQVPGSVAAPTAGLHFTSELLAALQKQGVEVARITLRIGLGTFRSLRVDRVAEHVMHREQFVLSAASAARVNRAKHEGRRVIAVGTTSCRVLETAATDQGLVVAQEGFSELFITPWLPL